LEIAIKRRKNALPLSVTKANKQNKQNKEVDQQK